MAHLLQFYKTINFLNHIFKSFISFLENLIIYILHFTSSPQKKIIHVLRIMYITCHCAVL